MNLRALSDDVLIAHTKESIRTEREATTTVLHHLREIERRMLYAKVGFESLIEYAIKELKYSESAAYRRVSAMRLLKEIPEIEGKIQSGELSLSTVAQAQTHFCQTKTTSVEEKKDVLQEIENLSARACERVLAEKRGETEPPERHKPLADGKTLVSFVLDDESKALLKEVQIELGQTLEMKALVKEMAKLSLQALRKRKSAVCKDVNGKGVPSGYVDSKDTKIRNVALKDIQFSGVTTKDVESKTVSANRVDCKGTAIKTANTKLKGTDKDNAVYNVAAKDAVVRANDIPSAEANAKRSARASTPTTSSSTPTWVAHHNGNQANYKSIPLQTKRAVWRRDKGRCQYHDPLTGRQCECTTHLQTEHIIPRARGGSNDLNNLELLCRAHNAYRAVQVFGPKHMKQFILSLQ